MNPRVSIVSLGCSRNDVDSEELAGRLVADGWSLTEGDQDTDVVLVNTCGFIDSAVEESLSAIGEALTENGKVIVTGCLGAKKNADGSDLVKSIHPKVLAVTGQIGRAHV